MIQQVKSYIVLTLLIAGMTALSGCHSDSDKVWNSSTDLLHEFRAGFHPETQHIDFRKIGKPESFLLRGWSSPTDKFTPINAQASSVAFYRYNVQQPLSIEISCGLFSSDPESTLPGEAFLNGESIGIFTVGTRDFQPFTLTAPAKALRSGLNILEFQFLRYSKDNKETSLGFYDIWFQTPQTLYHQSQEATQAIRFGAEANPGVYLREGWSYPESSHTWAAARTSNLVFFSYGAVTDVILEVTCQAIASKEAIPQETLVTLNGRDVGTIVIKPDSFQTFEVSLPASLVYAGQNLLGFHFAYTTRPVQLDRNIKDGRHLAAMFREIHFRQHETFPGFDGTGLVQRANSTVHLYSKLPQEFEISLAFQNMQGARGALELQGEQGQPIKISLPKKKTHLQKSVHLPAEGMYQIRLMSEGDPKGYTLWKQIVINTDEPDSAESSEQEEFSKVTAPDIILYVIDTLRADHLSCYGYERNTTPNIDRFARENSLFKNAYSAASWTRPGGATILTGLLAKNHKTMKRADKLPDEVVTLGEILQQKNYYTIAFVANYNLHRDFGFAQGFDQYIQMPKTKQSPYPVDSATVNTRVMKFLETYHQQKERKPLFLLVWTVDPHEPYTPLEDVQFLFDIEQYTPINTYDTKLLLKLLRGQLQLTESQIQYMMTRYDQEIYFNDRSFGVFLESLKTLKMYDDAVLILTSDHGEEFFEHGSVGHGWTLYNEQIQIPFIIKAPSIAKGTYDQRVQLTDIYPTILDITGMMAPYHLDGISLLDRSTTPRNLFFENRLDSNDQNAYLDQEKKVIFTKSVDMRRVSPQIPAYELFAVEDRREEHSLRISGINDEFRLQTLLSFRHRESLLQLQELEIDISPDLDRKLEELGYIK